MGCTFCASGLDGLLRNLSAGEMLGQVIAVNRDNGGSVKNRAVTNLVLMGSGEPFDNYDNTLKFLTLVSAEKGINIEAFDALSLAEEAGTSKAVNLVLLGRISKYFDFTDEEWMDAIEKSVPAKFLELNKKAFNLGKA